MKYLVLLIFSLILFYSCSESETGIADRQLELRAKIDSIDRVHDSLSTVMEASSDMRTDELVRIQLLIKKLDEQRAYLLKSYDSLGSELKK
jgi:hypothetical protein